jgi:hypothetical protein
MSKRAAIITLSLGLTFLAASAVAEFSLLNLPHAWQLFRAGLAAIIVGCVGVLLLRFGR